MAVSIAQQNWIVALFIRDDGRRLVLGDGAFEFKESQQHFTANTIVNDAVEVQGNDGVLLAGQVERSADQSFVGYIGDYSNTKADIEKYRREFIGFFQTRYFYTVVYVFADGSAIKRQRGYLTGAPEVKELFQISPEYSVKLNFEDVSYYEYTETEGGIETFSESASVGLATTQNGGVEWDAKGAKWDADGMVWEQGDGGTRIVANNSVRTVAPTIEIRGHSSNPRIENTTNGTALQYNGDIALGQTLRIDCVNQTASLDGDDVTALMSGTWLRLNAGDNAIVYFADNNDAPSALILWSSIVA